MRFAIPRCERTTTPSRVAAAIAAGLFAACFVCLLVLAILVGTPPLPRHPGEIAGMAAGALIGFPLLASVAGCPALAAWVVLHVCRLHFAGAALAVGALTGGGWGLLFLTLHTPTAIALVVAGSVSGLVTWRVAYGPFFAAPRRLGSPGEVQTG